MGQMMLARKQRHPLQSIEVGKLSAGKTSIPTADGSSPVGKGSIRWRKFVRKESEEQLEESEEQLEESEHIYGAAVNEDMSIGKKF